MPIRNLSELSTNNLRKKALEVLNSALISLNPRNVVKEKATVLEKEIEPNSKISVFGFGKAAENMYLGFRDVFPGRISKAFLIIPKDEEFKSSFPELTVLRGTHPFPSDLSVQASNRLVQEVEGCGIEDSVVFLISGGGSALFEIPREGLTINELSDITSCVMSNGADIAQLNTLRILLSSVKGGKLLNRINSKTIHALYISDVVTNDLHFIASGPLIPFSDREQTSSVLTKFENCLGEKAKTIISSEDTPVISEKNVRNRLILTNEDFVTSMALKLETDKKVLNLGHTLSGDVEILSKNILSRLRAEGQKRKSNFWFVGAGESTVTLKGSGMGGRNQELCLHILMNQKQEEKILFVSAGTDGIDGNSPAMGGVVDQETVEDSNTNEISEYIDRNDSYGFLSEHNGAIISGRTGNNVSDVILGHYATWNDRY